MTHNEALSKLELEEGATSSEINSQYQEFYNEFQMRITNAPTEHQRKLYQKKMEELTQAFEILSGDSSESNTQELPGITESDIVENEKAIDQTVLHPIEMSKEKALQFLGLSEKFTSKELENAFKSKVSSCETGRDNAISTSIRNAYEDAILECNSAHKLLKQFVFVSAPVLKTTPATSHVSKDTSKSKRKWVLPVSIVSGVIIVIILFFAFSKMNSKTDEITDPTTNIEYVKLKAEADLLAIQGNWKDALNKYEAVYLIVETSEVKDSIISMNSHVALASNEKINNTDEVIKGQNQLAGEEIKRRNKLAEEEQRKVDAQIAAEDELVRKKEAEEELIRKNRLEEKQKQIEADEIKSDPYNFSTPTRFAKILNENLQYARINFSEPSYKFSLLGRTDLIKSSFEFIVKNNTLYAKIYIPQNTGCDSGLKEIKVKWTGQSGSAGFISRPGFYFTVAYSYSCNDKTYSTIYFSLEGIMNGLFYEKVKVNIPK